MSFDSVELSEVLIDKGYIRGPFGSALKRGEMKDSGIPVYEQNHAIYDEREFRYFIDKEKYEELKRFQVKKNDLIISCSGTVGEISIINENDPVGIISQALLILRVNAEVILPQYLRFYFTSRTGKHLLLGASHGSVQNNIAKKSIVSSIPIPLPSLEVQRDIVKQLYTLDQKIQLNQQTNKTLEAMAQAIFKSWFVDFDPVQAKIRAKAEGRDANRAAMAAIAGVDLEQDWDEIEAALDQKLSRMSEAQRQQLHETADLFPDELVDSELGDVPRGWGVKSLDEIADYLNGKAMQKYPPEDGKDTLPVLKIAQLRKGDTDGADIATADIPEKFKISDGDMIFSWSGSLLVKLWAGGEAALNQHLFKVTSQEYDQWLYYHWTKFHLANFIRIAESKAVTMGHIKRSHLKEAKCVIPGNELLEFGKQHIEPLLAQALQQNLESRNLAELRDTLLPKLISGEIGL